MTRFTVVWDKELESTFANTWIAGDSNIRRALTEIADWIDSNLTDDPHTKGEPRADVAERVVSVPFSAPYARVDAIFQVLREDRIVRGTRLVFRSI